MSEQEFIEVMQAHGLTPIIGYNGLNYFVSSIRFGDLRVHYQMRTGKCSLIGDRIYPRRWYGTASGLSKEIAKQMNHGSLTNEQP